MKVMVTKEFPGRPDAEANVRPIRVGEIVGGELAKVALAEKWGEEVAGDDAESAVDLSNMTVADLKALASERGVDLGDATKKADIIAVLEKIIQG